MMKYIMFEEVVKIDRTAATDEECVMLPYVGLEHIEKDTGHFVVGFKPHPETLLASKFRFTSKHVLYGKLRPYLNKVVLPAFDGVCTTEILPLQPIERKLDRVYLWAILQSPTFLAWASSNLSGANLPRLDPKLLLTYRLPLPSLPEQKRLATILEKADRLRRLRRYALELSGTYLQSVFLEMFGDPSKNVKKWPTDYLYQLCDKIVDCPHSTPIYAPMSTPYACIRSSDIQEGVLDWSTTKYVDYQEYQKRIHTHVPMPNEIVYCREGARFGNAAIIPSGKKVCLGQRMMLFRAAPNIATPEFIWAFLESESTHRQANRLVGGSASPHLNVGDIREFVAIIPPFSLQQEYAQVVQKYERLRAQQREAERQAEHLFQTLLHKAFQGELSREDELLMPDVEEVERQTPAFADVIEPIDSDAYQLALPLE